MANDLGPSETEVKKELGKHIRELRLSMGFENCASLAKVLGCNPAEVKNWEAGKTAPRYHRLNQLSRLAKRKKLPVF